VDCSDQALALCRKRYPRGEFCYRNLDSQTPFLGLNPDVIVSLETAEHLRGPVRFIESCFEALQGNGSLVFSVPTCLTRDYDPYHRRDWSEHRWATLLIESGFNIRECHALSVEGSFREFIDTVPTTLRQKARVAAFNLVHPRYLIDRVWNWGFRNRFSWTSTLWICDTKPSSRIWSNGRKHLRSNSVNV
jgi:hypothetical protein